MSGNLDQRTEVIPASGVVTLPPANFIFVLSSSVNTLLKLTRLGASVRGANIENYGSSNLGGLQIYRTQRWDVATLTGAPGGTVTFIYGTTDIREDGTLFTQQIATVSGIVSTAESPSSTIIDTAQAVLAPAAQTAIAANLTRRRITIGNLSTSLASLFVSQAGGDGRGIEIQPGTFTEFKTTAALIVRNVTGSPGNLTWYAEEES